MLRLADGGGGFVAGRGGVGDATGGPPCGIGGGEAGVLREEEREEKRDVGTFHSRTGRGGAERLGYRGIISQVGLGKWAATGGRRDGLLIGPHGDVALGASEDDAAVGGDAEGGVWQGRCATAYYHDVVGYEWGVILS